MVRGAVILAKLLVQLYTLTDRDAWCHDTAAVVWLPPPVAGALPGDDPPTRLRAPTLWRDCHALCCAGSDSDFDVAAVTEAAARNKLGGRDQVLGTTALGIDQRAAALQSRFHLCLWPASGSSCAHYFARKLGCGCRLPNSPKLLAHRRTALSAPLCRPTAAPRRARYATASFQSPVSFALFQQDCTVAVLSSHLRCRRGTAGMQAVARSPERTDHCTPPSAHSSLQDS